MSNRRSRPRLGSPGALGSLGMYSIYGGPATYFKVERLLHTPSAGVRFECGGVEGMSGNCERGGNRLCFLCV